MYIDVILMNRGLFNERNAFICKLLSNGFAFICTKDIGLQRNRSSPVGKDSLFHVCLDL